MLGSAVIDRAQRILNDTTAVRWLAADLLDWLNEGQLAAVRIAPEAHTVTAIFQLVTGVRQNLTALAVTASTEAPLRLIEVVRNVTDATGFPALRAIRMVNRRSLDQGNPDWPADTAAALVENYMFDSRNPKEFMVYPPQPATGGFVEVVYSAEPAALSLDSDPIALDDSYGPALVDYIVYRALSTDAEYGENSAKVAQHFNQFMGALTQKTGIDASVEPLPATTTVE